MKSFIKILIIGILLSACDSTVNTDLNFIISDSITDTDSLPFEPIDTVFDRSSIIERLTAKKADGLPLIVHAFVPLCDNEHQGIIPTSESLGDGLNLKTNLYWATSGGIKGYFKNQADWKIIYDEYDTTSNVLERIVFTKVYPGATVYFVADAYRGDKMEETVNDFLAAISGNLAQNIYIDEGEVLGAGSYADLIIFNGHNGVMDYINIDSWINKTNKRTDVVMNSCVSYGYLQEEFMLAGGYPLVRSQTLLYPGAYVLEQIIEDWVAGIDEEQICLNAGKVYCKKHDCGAGTKVYKTGW